MTATYVCSPDIRITELDGEGIVLHLANRRYFTVSSSGLLILSALKTQQTFDHVVDILLGTYDVNREEASETATTFLAECAAHGMVVVEKHQ